MSALGPSFGLKIHIAQNAYCSRDIYFQFNKVRRSVILRAIMQRLYESALRWPEPIYLRVGYVFESGFSVGMI